MGLASLSKPYLRCDYHCELNQQRSKVRILLISTANPDSIPVRILGPSRIRHRLLKPRQPRILLPKPRNTKICNGLLHLGIPISHRHDDPAVPSSRCFVLRTLLLVLAVGLHFPRFRRRSCVHKRAAHKMSGAGREACFDNGRNEVMVDERCLGRGWGNGVDCDVGLW